MTATAHLTGIGLGSRPMPNLLYSENVRGTCHDCGMPQETSTLSEDWIEVAAVVAASLEGAKSNQFVLIQYDTGIADGPAPYAQIAPDGELWRCEVVSGHYLPESVWALDEAWLRRNGWSVEPGGASNWFRSANDVLGSAISAVVGLRCGRRCPDPGRLVVEVQTYADRVWPSDGEAAAAGWDDNGSGPPATIASD